MCFCLRVVVLVDSCSARHIQTMQRKQAFFLLLFAILFFAAAPVHGKYEEFSHIIVIVLEVKMHNI